MQQWHALCTKGSSHAGNASVLREARSFSSGAARELEACV